MGEIFLVEGAYSIVIGKCFAKETKTHRQRSCRGKAASAVTGMSKDHPVPICPGEGKSLIARSTSISQKGQRVK